MGCISCVHSSFSPYSWYQISNLKNWI
jgi:hypothetical protein